MPRAETVLWRAENDVAHALTRMLPEDVEDALRKNIPAAFIGHSKQASISHPRAAASSPPPLGLSLDLARGLTCTPTAGCPGVS